MTAAREEEFARYVEQHSRALQNEACYEHTNGNEHDAEELVQAALLVTWQHWHEIQDAKARRAYIRTIMRNTWISWHRRKRVKLHFTDELPEESYEDPEPVDGRTLNEVLNDAVDRLSPRQREVITLRYLNGLMEVQAAKKLGVTVGTIKTTASRALAALRADEDLRQAWLDSR